MNPFEQKLAQTIESAYERRGRNVKSSPWLFQEALDHSEQVIESNFSGMEQGLEERKRKYKNFDQACFVTEKFGESGRLQRTEYGQILESIVKFVSKKIKTINSFGVAVRRLKSNDGMHAFLVVIFLMWLPQTNNIESYPKVVIGFIFSKLIFSF